MAKTYIDTVKYLIYADVEINGVVEKPDVVGAIFGQTEGLLGDDLDLRNLQKNGRIGRIEVELVAKGGKTYGTLKIPSSLDMVETSIVGAALEIVDRVGPCEAKVKVIKIEDTRNEKRKIVIEKAKELLKALLSTEIPESKELSDIVRNEVKIAEVIELGQEKLPAGPGAEKASEIILVEGRADVINLLKNDITNVIGIGGAKISKTIVDLSKGKEVTAFLDGDRGGDIILNELIQAGVEIDYIARAPPGKEVEELTRKEIAKALRNRVPFEQAEEKKSTQKRVITAEDAINVEQNKVIISSVQSVLTKSDENQKIKSKEDFIKELEELNGTLKARLYDRNGKLIQEVMVRDIVKALSEIEGVETVVFDGIITQRLADIASEKGIRMIIGMREGNLTKKPQNVEIYTKFK